MIDGHGDDLYRYGDRIKHNFSSNILQGVDHTDLKKHLASRLDVINNYPEPAPFSVEALLSKEYGVPIDCVMVTNGAADVIHIIARAYQNSHSAVLQPTFAEYSDACSISKHDIVYFSDLNSLPVSSKLVWICNPNNPDGKAYDRDCISALISANPDKIFVIDQAYHKYTHCLVLNPDEVMRHDNLILLYSMTKDFAIPGLRLGYIVTNVDIMDRLKCYRVPWSVNSIAIEAAKFLLTGRRVSIDVDGLLSEAKRVSTALNALGIEVKASDTNFILCRLPKGSAASLKEFLVVTHNILIRDASNFTGLTARHFRIAVQTPPENDLLINAIGQWMHS